ncbi:gamma-glutamyltransferase family protein [Microbacterium sp. SA39]|uniref:gamma-glutamyltransferase family protein n=1 Tax=Microbacterium sp. SA39 TaxID=1263625 RepID=UPI00061F8DB8|nr:gamma-glutamyltransferase [Microbacterium sp. SA39]KJQ53866.1 Capsule biosynthesis protein CapD precursor [Microbacterium sp. SA39]
MKPSILRRGAALVAAGLILTACTPVEPPPEPQSETATPTPSPAPPALNGGAVAAGHPLAAAVGTAILDAGGNAVDAAIGTAFADTVLQPDASSLGGGGSAIVADTEEVSYVDYRDEVNLAGTVPAGGAGIPGFVAGMAALHDRYGSLEWSEILQGALALARDGAPLSDYLAGQMRYLPTRIDSTPAFFNAAGNRLQAGETLVQPDLAATLQTLAAEGPDAFYRGSLVPTLASVQGFDAESLAAYEVQWSVPPAGEFGEYTVVSASPALPGAAVIQQLQIEEALGLAGTAPNSAEFIDVQTKAWRIANNSIQTLFGDPAFVDVPVDQLTDPELNAALAASGGGSTSSDSPEVDGNTTHISVVDEDGLTVSMTNTVTNFWGSGQYVAGFFLNDALERFDDIGAAGLNVVRPGARSVSWSAPSLVLDQTGRPVLVIGLPGGRQIPSSLATVIGLWALHDFSVVDAVLAPRFQLLPNDTLRVEQGAPVDALRALGYRVEVSDASAVFGSVQALEIDWSSKSILGHPDPRRAAGVSYTTP